jgi:hypothetical protein
LSHRVGDRRVVEIRKYQRNAGVYIPVQSQPTSELFHPAQYARIDKAAGRLVRKGVERGELMQLQPNPTNKRIDIIGPISMALCLEVISDRRN